jgi:hypothetical protein
MNYAYVLMHFGSNVKYLEYEIYSILMLKSITKYDIIYLYSIIDTPRIFLKLIKNLGVKTFGFDDSIIVEKTKKFSSVYSHFNTLRTCCFIYSNLLTSYDKICLVESDIIFYKGFDDIFNLKTPSVSIYSSNIYDPELLINYKKKININNILKICNVSSPINGGVMLIKPDPSVLKTFDKNLSLILQSKCAYPNEILFVLIYRNIYNLPINYNYRKNINLDDVKIYGHHFSSTIYKPLDIIKDNYIDKLKYKSEQDSINFFKKKYYDDNKELILKILNKIKKKI